MDPNGFDCVFAATWIKTTNRGAVPWNHLLISPDCPNKEFFNHRDSLDIFWNTCVIWFFIWIPDDRTIEGLAIKTTSKQPMIWEYSLRTTSRKIRFILFRTTAFPTFLLTVRPILEQSPFWDWKSTIRFLVWKRFPWVWTFIKSSLLRRRYFFNQG